MNKTVFITGASAGFGKETAVAFQQHGWNVVATMRSPEKSEEFSLLKNVLVTRLDVQDEQSIETAVQAAIKKFGGIDVLVNNAGYGLMGVFESATREQIQNQYAVNVFGLMHVTRAVLPHMRANGSGVIINISSFGGVVGLPFGSLYNSSKFAVEGFSESLSHELAPTNIAVKIVEPGGVATNFRNGLDLREYSFFNYDVNEALHISDDEKQTLLDCLEKIKREYSQNIDKHTQGLIADNLRLLLNYCNRFYDRQFLTRAKVNNDLVQQFEQLLHDYFASDLIEAGLPGVKYFASKLNLSSHYLSDLLNKYTGKTTQEFIHLAFAEKAKHLLRSTQKPVSEIAYELGFEHPSHFTKLFKAQTGQSPREFRKVG